MIFFSPLSKLHSSASNILYRDISLNILGFASEFLIMTALEIIESLLSLQKTIVCCADICLSLPKDEIFTQRKRGGCPLIVCVLGAWKCLRKSDKSATPTPQAIYDARVSHLFFFSLLEFPGFNTREQSRTLSCLYQYISLTDCVYQLNKGSNLIRTCRECIKIFFQLCCK